jgi:molybdenum-dependent DNA-binding transcriptional regulator ModE
MYRLEKLNGKGEVEKTKEYKTIKECAKAFDMPYHVIQRLVYYSNGDMVYKKAVTSRTKKLIADYRIIKVEKVIEVDMKEKDEKQIEEVLEELVEKNV